MAGPPIPADLRELADATARGSRDRVSRFDWNGLSLWVKKATSDKTNRWNRVQRVAAKLVPFPMLRPTISGGGSAGIEREARRIRHFDAAGMRVPRVFGVGEQWLLLEDLGTVVENRLRRDPSTLETDVADCARGVAALHRAGLAHGRAKLNDLVRLDDGSIGFIDFEEELDDAGIPLTTLQARDVWLFTCSTARFAAVDPDIARKAVVFYLAASDDRAVRAELVRLRRVLAPLRLLLRPFAARLRKDLRRAYFAAAGLDGALR